MNENDQKLIAFQIEEARWIDSVVRPHIPALFRNYKAFLGKGSQGIFKRLQHFLIDYVLIARIIRIRVVRNQDQEMLGGKGYRPGFSKTRLNRIRTVVFKGKTEIAQKAFQIGIIIN